MTAYSNTRSPVREAFCLIKSRSLSTQPILFEHVHPRVSVRDQSRDINSLYLQTYLCNLAR